MIDSMKINIQGNGAFGSFLKELFAAYFAISDDSEVVILAVPISAYDELGAKFKNKHLINVCSVQEPSTNILLKYTDRITSIHPLFGRRTPADKRNSILTYSSLKDNDTWQSGGLELDFLNDFKKISKVITHFPAKYGRDILATPQEHDKLMVKTHVAALMAAKQLQVYIERAENIPDELIPHSFRLMREFVKTLDDMPPGTTESILANTYF